MKTKLTSPQIPNASRIVSSHQSAHTQHTATLQTPTPIAVPAQSADILFAQQANAAPQAKLSPLSLQIQHNTQQALPVSSPVVAQPALAKQASPAMVQASAEVNAPKSADQQKLETIQTFYRALEQQDFKTLMSLYHPDATFRDPAFPNLKGDKLQAMWKLITSKEGLSVKHSDVRLQADGSVSGHWDANYELIKGNPIFNQIDSKFEFKDGKIYKHTDNFSFSKWSKQAFPWGLGRLIGTRVGQFVMQKVLRATL